MSRLKMEQEAEEKMRTVLRKCHIYKHVCTYIYTRNVPIWPIHGQYGSVRGTRSPVQEKEAGTHAGRTHKASQQ